MRETTWSAARQRVNARIWPLVEAAGVGAERVGLPADLWSEVEALGLARADDLVTFYTPTGRLTLYPLEGVPATLANPVDADGRPVEGA